MARYKIGATTDQIDLIAQAIRKHGSQSLVNQTNLRGRDPAVQVENTDTRGELSLRSHRLRELEGQESPGAGGVVHPPVR